MNTTSPANPGKSPIELRFEAHNNGKPIASNLNIYAAFELSACLPMH